MKTFRATYNGDDIWDWVLPKSGIQFSARLEHIYAAIWAEGSYSRFCELDGTLQSELVAAYRTKLQTEGILAAVQAAEIEARAKG